MKMLSICAFNFYFQIYMYLHILPANICSPYHLHQVRNLLPANDKKFTTSFSLGKRGGKEMSIQVRTFSVPYSFTWSRLLQKMTKLNAYSLSCVGHITIRVFQVNKKKEKGNYPTSLANKRCSGDADDESKFFDVSVSVLVISDDIFGPSVSDVTCLHPVLMILLPCLVSL